MAIKTIGVVGSGQMGSGIAQVAATCGFRVLLQDLKQEIVDNSIAGIKGRLERAASKGKLDPAEIKNIMGRIEGTTDLTKFKHVDYAIEAATENHAIKREIFKKLDEVCSAETILATNTSSISITKIAGWTNRGDRIVGMHFMNPVPVMPLVEGICGLATSEQTLAAMKEVAEKMGKVVVMAKDSPGFVVNRILMPMINEAIEALREGLASAEDIDTAMKLGTNQPMGPLTLADFVGLDTCLAIMEVLHKELGDDKYRPSPLLRQYVDAGWLGKKSGRGFFVYDK